MNSRRPGIRQQTLLNVMHRHGGTYPASWRVTYETRRQLERMRTRGWITLVAHSSGKQVYRLTGARP